MKWEKAEGENKQFAAFYHLLLKCYYMYQISTAILQCLTVYRKYSPAASINSNSTSIIIFIRASQVSHSKSNPVGISIFAGNDHFASTIIISVCHPIGCSHDIRQPSLIYYAVIQIFATVGFKVKIVPLKG